LRHELANFKKRLKALEAIVAEDGIIMIEVQVQALEKTRNWCGAARTNKTGELAWPELCKVHHLTEKIPA